MLLNPGDLLAAGVIFCALAFAGALALVIAQNLRGLEPIRLAGLALLGIYSGAAMVTVFLTGSAWAVLVPLALVAGATLAARRKLENFTVSGRVFLMTNVLLLIFSSLWGAWFIATMPVSTLTRALMFAGYLPLLFTLYVGLVQTFEQWEVLLRRVWARPRTPLPPAPRNHYPKVSFHVATYAEPPEVVMETLDALARMKYPNFEVLVIDNNTKDPNLWQPVEAHCQKLGDRFRFHHVDPLSGAKAGALNFALQHTAPDAEVVGVIDSDYQAAPDFLERLIGYFDDPRTGFVQTPHDYRGWENSPYLRTCYWEYKYFFETMLVSRNERDSAITVGTMCLIRRQALEEAGGWSEWCVTEDSELAIRIHALGYSSVYLTSSFGRGLIPETFAGYKKQRFRWTYGPVQELKRHFRLLVPKPLSRPSALSPFQKIHHLNHGLDRLSVGLGFLLLPLGGAILISMLVHGEVVPVPQPLWVTASVMLVSGFATRWLTYRVVMRCSLLDMLGSLLASKSLTHTVNMASLWGVFTRSIPWRRTSKFKVLPGGLGALSSAQTELLLGLMVWVTAGVVVAVLPEPGLHLMILVGALFQSSTFLAAPAMAFLAELDLRSRRRAEVAAPAALRATGMGD